MNESQFGRCMIAVLHLRSCCISEEAELSLAPSAAAGTTVLRAALPCAMFLPATSWRSVPAILCRGAGGYLVGLWSRIADFLSGVGIPEMPGARLVGGLRLVRRLVVRLVRQ